MATAYLNPQDTQLRAAVPADAEAMAALINRAYRGESSRAGWTTEADILTGVRTTVAELQERISQPQIRFFTAWQEQQLCATLCAEWQPAKSCVHLGMIAVEPQLQNRGLGKAMIFAAEHWASQQWGALIAQMSVIHLRHSLIAFYQRLGYQPTGEVRPFPAQSTLWQLQVPHLELITLQKSLSLASSAPTAMAETSP